MQHIQRFDFLELARIDDLNLLKMILSSADDFPGMYKISLQHQAFWADPEYLKLIHFLEWNLKMNQAIHKKELLLAHNKLQEFTFSKSDRNTKRTNENVKADFPKRNSFWIEKLKKIYLVCIDNVLPVEKVLLNQTYYFMGGLICFKEKSVVVGDLSLDVGFNEVEKYISTTFSSSQVQQLFFKAELLGFFDYSNSELSTYQDLNKNSEQLLSQFHPSSLIVGTNNPNKPISLAKPIALPNLNLIKGLN